MKYDGLVVGQAVRNLRTEKKLTIEKLSELVDKSPSHINQLELGSRKMSIDLLYSLMNVLETDANRVLGIPEQKENAREMVSIDNKLQQLNASQRRYLTEMFLQMIEKIPA